MKNLKKLMGIVLTGTALLASGCGSNEQAQNESSNANESAVETTNTDNASSDSKKTLIVYFAYSENIDLPENADASSRASIRPTEDGVIGNTGAIARMIQKDVDADIVSLKTAEKYYVDYDETLNKAKSELETNARPALATHIDNIDNYDTIFVGYPNWWADMPMAMYTFFDEYDLSGKTIIPFSTSGGSGLSNTVNEIKELEPNAQVRDGLTISNKEIDGAQSEVDNWLKGLGYLE